MPKAVKLKFKKISDKLANEDKINFVNLKNSFKKINSVEKLISLISMIDK